VKRQASPFQALGASAEAKKEFEARVARVPISEPLQQLALKAMAAKQSEVAMARVTKQIALALRYIGVT